MFGVFVIISFATIATKFTAVHDRRNTVHSIVMGFGFSTTVFVIGFHQLNHFRCKLVLFSSKNDAATNWINNNELVTLWTQIILKFFNFFVPT